MQAIEFEATPFQHTIRVPDSVPDGVSVRVLLLVDETITSQRDTTGEQFKSLLESMPDVGHDQDFMRDYEDIVAPKDENKRQAALAHIAAQQVNWQGKPIADRNALYDDARGN